MYSFLLLPSHLSFSKTEATHHLSSPPPHFNLDCSQLLHGYDDWGLDHPQRSRESNSATKITWTGQYIFVLFLKLTSRDFYILCTVEAEKSFVNEFIESCPKMEKYSLCLEAIVAGGPDVRRIFHKHHVKDSTRLRGGVRRKQLEKK